MQHAYPLDDLLDGPPEPSPEEVRAQVEDWLERLRALFGGIREWATSNGWTIEPQAPVQMLERPMQQTGLPPVEIESFVVHRPGGGRVWVRPKALWVIGANGRVDLFATNGVYVLIDIAESMATPEWVCHRVGRGPVQPFEPEQLAQMA